MMNLFEHLGATLKPHALLVSRGSINQANQLLNHTPAMSITETFREQLKVIAQGVDVNINSLLNMATTDQLNEMVQAHKHIGWSDPHDYVSMYLNGLTKEADGNWYLHFQDLDQDIPRYLIHDLDIEDVLGFLATCENILIPDTNETVA